MKHFRLGAVFIAQSLLPTAVADEPPIAVQLANWHQSCGEDRFVWISKFSRTLWQ